jgi:hypothetical protein
MPRKHPASKRDKWNTALEKTPHDFKAGDTVRILGDKKGPYPVVRVRSYLGQDDKLLLQLGPDFTDLVWVGHCEKARGLNEKIAN